MAMLSKNLRSNELHKLYARLEPFILRTLDKILRSRFFARNRIGKALLKGLAKILWFLPHGVVIDYNTAKKIIEFIGRTGKGHIAIGPCVCKKALGVNDEPMMTDMTILYGAEIYREISEEYHEITADEALKLLRKFEEYGLVHEIYACMRSSKWTFVICNCDCRYCVPTKAYLVTGEGIAPGPYKAIVNPEKCRGVRNCGKCIEVCNFNAIEERNGKAFVNDRCMGCGLCVNKCPGSARTLAPRPNYRIHILDLINKIREP